MTHVELRAAAGRAFDIALILVTLWLMARFDSFGWALLLGLSPRAWVTRW